MSPVREYTAPYSMVPWPAVICPFATFAEKRIIGTIAATASLGIDILMDVDEPNVKINIAAGRWTCVVRR